PQEATPLYYIAFSNFEFYKIANNLSKKMLLTKVITNINYGLQKDKNKADFSKFDNKMSTIHDSILIFADRMWIKDKNQAEYFYENLVKIYNDTTPEYREIFIPVIEVFEQNLAFKEHTGPTNQTDIAGNRQGLWIKEYDDGIIESEIFFKDNHPAGVFRKYYTSGILKANMYFDETGDTTAAILYNENGEKTAMGYYYKQQKDSLWQYYINDSIVITEEFYSNGVKNGAERTYSPYSYPNILEEKYWKNGVQDSTWTKCFTTGQPRMITEFKNGVRDGKYVAFNEEGTTIVTGQYTNNKPDGLWKIWDYDEQKIIQIEYKNGVPINEDELSETENQILKDMENMRGEIEEPGQNIYDDYNGGNY
ncbi:MAG: hypothetical protein U9N34_08180, partial [Candidatus Cloacimonadota bacterium]|nr:hypothetical protein [Candidatus Cloacimonadota bacterium]